jgi:hypothetical protein
MKSSTMQILCRFLAVLIMLLPYQTGHAAMIGTDLAASPAAAQADRNAIASFLSRAQTVNELQSLGLDAQVAQERVAAMTDAEASSLAGRMNALPAGGDGLVVLILVIFVIWLVAFRR